MVLQIMQDTEDAIKYYEAKGDHRRVQVLKDGFIYFWKMYLM